MILSVMEKIHMYIANDLEFRIQSLHGAHI